MATRKPILDYAKIVVLNDQAMARTVAAAGAHLAIVRRGILRWIVFQCPCGCGELITLNLDKRTGPHWRIWRRKNSLSINPSVWRTSGCQSHFVLKQNHVFMMQDLYPSHRPQAMATASARETPTSIERAHLPRP